MSDTRHDFSSDGYQSDGSEFYSVDSSDESVDGFSVESDVDSGEIIASPSDADVMTDDSEENGYSQKEQISSFNHDDGKLSYASAQSHEPVIESGFSHQELFWQNLAVPSSSRVFQRIGVTPENFNNSAYSREQTPTEKNQDLERLFTKMEKGEFNHLLPSSREQEKGEGENDRYVSKSLSQPDSKLRNVLRLS